jgi:uncharacterized coiled-coil protein SlyX
MEKRTMAMEQRLTKMEDIIQKNTTLRADLTSAQELIADLQQQLATLHEKKSFSNPATPSHFFANPTSMKDSIHAPSSTIATTTPVKPTPSVTYASVAKTPTPKKGNPLPKQKKKRTRMTPQPHGGCQVVGWDPNERETSSRHGIKREQKFY